MQKKFALIFGPYSHTECKTSGPEIHTPPPQNRRSTWRVQNRGWFSTALLLNEVSENKSREIRNEVSEIFSDVCSEVCPEIRPEIFPSPPKIPRDEEGLLWGWCVVGGPLKTTLSFLVVCYSTNITSVHINSTTVCT